MGFLTKVFRPCPRHSKDLKFDLPSMTSEYTYTGEAITPVISGFYSDFMEASGDTSATDVGEYEITITLKNAEKSCFKDGSLDGSTEPVTLQWKIVEV